ncbi:MAG: N-acetylglucosaminyl-phosphatidylinositol de-N-acetylase [Vezdaea aestivalis]|nr:MAG: N-acetylglucosaminyl-phosphatidylinositol de-N-acetylase [Vezdaea aestivalis]
MRSRSPSSRSPTPRRPSLATPARGGARLPVSIPNYAAPPPPPPRPLFGSAASPSYPSSYNRYGASSSSSSSYNPYAASSKRYGASSSSSSNRYGASSSSSSSRGRWGAKSSSTSSKSTPTRARHSSSYTPFALKHTPLASPIAVGGGPAAAGGMSSFTFFLLVLAPIIVLVAWTWAAGTTRVAYPVLRNKRIVLLIAHPDDEAMFFAPSVMALAEKEQGNHVKILCLSSGDADGLGEVRKKELAKSGLLLGLQKEDDVFVVDDPTFPDSSNTWPSTPIASLLTQAFLPPPSSSPKAHSTSTSTSHPPKTKRLHPPATPPLRPSIDVLVTFDPYGVSSHPNHISLYHGAREFMSSLPEDADVKLFTLTTVPIWRKYLGVLDAFAIGWALRPRDETVAKKESVEGEIKDEGEGEQTVGKEEKTKTDLVKRSKKKTEAKVEVAKEEEAEKVSELEEHKPVQDEIDDMVFVSGPWMWFKAVRAMTQAHKSQMVWFRWGWIGLSRYMSVNELTRVKIE